jgi:hypothetical protein
MLKILVLKSEPEDYHHFILTRHCTQFPKSDVYVLIKQIIICFFVDLGLFDLLIEWWIEELLYLMSKDFMTTINYALMS